MTPEWLEGRISEQAEGVAGWVEHDPEFVRVSVRGLLRRDTTTGGEHRGDRSVEVVDLDLEVQHLRRGAGQFGPDRRLVPLLGLERQPDPARRVGERHPPGPAPAIGNVVACRHVPAEQPRVERGELLGIRTVEAHTGPADSCHGPARVHIRRPPPSDAAPACPKYSRGNIASTSPARFGAVARRAPYSGRVVMAAAGEFILRAVAVADLEVLFEQQSDAAANEMAGFPARERDAFMAHWARIMADTTGEIRVIDVGGAIAGNIVAFEHDGRREVGYWLGRAWWGRGIATRALRRFLDDVEHTRPIHAGVVEHNLASIRVLERAGFVELGRHDDEIAFVLDS